MGKCCKNTIFLVNELKKYLVNFAESIRLLMFAGQTMKIINNSSNYDGTRN